ncbi:MAG: phosphatase PAP2 family protein [Eubacteriaceae bacterium]|nr:phosphatase PAP2 family protein [Eubacteriaceae bacterium]
MITNIDLVILRFMESIHNPMTDFIFSAITYLGDDGKLWIGIALLLLFFPKHRKTALAMIVGLITFHVLCNSILKDLIGRPRPFVLVPELLNSIPDVVDVPSSFSMPSGHTMMSFVCAEILGRNIPKSKIPAYAAAVLMGLSRIYLLVHYPSDVIVGAALGILLAITIDKAKNKLIRQKAA